MQYGVHIFPTEHSIQPAELARAAEDRGLESVWFSEHSHIPVQVLNTPGPRYPLADHYWQTYDLFIAMTLAAAATTRIKVASGVALVNQRDTIDLAKETATLDRISRGRLILGVGAGWDEQEMADHGTVYRTRFLLLKEQIRAIREIWTTEESEFHGKLVSFEKMRSFPKPLQRPGPPIIMGGKGDKSLEVAAEVCDGWAPYLLEWPKAKAAIAEVMRLAAARGRDPDALEFSVFERNIPGSETMEEMEAAGVRRVILALFGQGREEVLPRLDLLAEANAFG